MPVLTLGAPFIVHRRLTGRYLMFNMGGGELIVAALLALLLIKPDKLPGVATSLGRWFHDLQRGISDVKRSVEQNLKEEKDKDKT